MVSVCTVVSDQWTVYSLQFVVAVAGTRDCFPGYTKIVDHLVWWIRSSSHTLQSRTAGLSTAFVAKNAANSAQDDKVFFDANFRLRTLA